MHTLQPPALVTSQAPLSSKRRKMSVRRSLRRHWQLYLLIIPTMVYFLVFKYIPMSNAVLAFKNYNVVQGIWGSDWAGWVNFRTFFNNPVFWSLVKNTFLLSFYGKIYGLPQWNDCGKADEIPLSADARDILIPYFMNAFLYNPQGTNGNTNSTLVLNNGKVDTQANKDGRRAGEVSQAALQAGRGQARVAADRRRLGAARAVRQHARVEVATLQTNVENYTQQTAYDEAPK